MIRWDFVSNSSSTSGNFPPLCLMPPFGVLNETIYEEPFYSPEEYNYFTIKMPNKKYKVYYRMIEHDQKREIEPRFIKKFNVEYDTLEDVLMKFPTALYCPDEFELCRKIFEKDSLKHINIDQNGFYFCVK